MENTPIDFRKERDFGEVFGATFEFIRQEYKRLGTVLIYYVLPVLVIVSLVLILIQSQYLDTFMEFSRNSSYGTFNTFGEFFIYYFLIMLCQLVIQTMLITAVYSYITIYATNGKEGFEARDVWNTMLYYFFPVMGTSLLAGILIGLGFVFCIIPGIYLGISLSLILIVLIHEKKGFGDAFSRSFQLTGKDWWMTLLMVIVAFLLVTVLGYVIQLPAIIMGMGSMWTTISDTIRNPENISNPKDIFSSSYIIVTTLLGVLTYVLYIIPHMILAFQYFNLVEKFEKPTLMDKIDQMGRNEPN